MSWKWSQRVENEMTLEKLIEKRDHLKKVRDDTYTRIAREAPPEGCYWPPRHQEILYKFRDLCDKALEQAEKELTSLRITMELH